jgi:hypothetical protein
MSQGPRQPIFVQPSPLDEAFAKTTATLTAEFNQFVEEVTRPFLPEQSKLKVEEIKDY